MVSGREDGDGTRLAKVSKRTRAAKDGAKERGRRGRGGEEEAI